MLTPYESNNEREKTEGKSNSTGQTQYKRTRRSISAGGRPFNNQQTRASRADVHAGDFAM